MPVGVQVKDVYDSSEELALVHKAKQGDEAAFRALYDAHHNHVVIVITRFVHNPADVEEVAEKTLTNVWKALPRFKEQSKFSTWVTRIAINEAQMHLRVEKKKQCEVSLDALLTHGSEGDYETSDVSYAQRWVAIRDLELAGIADRQLLERAIGRVPKQYQEILRLRFWEGMSLDEIQANLSDEDVVSIPAVKSRILRGRRMLLKQVARIS